MIISPDLIHKHTDETKFNPLNSKGYIACFRFYRNDLKLPCTWGTENSNYASFMLGENAGITLFRADFISIVTDKSGDNPLVTGSDKSVIVIEVADVDIIYKKYTERGVKFINEPCDYPDWTIRAVHLRDPEDNLIEICSALPMDKWTKEVTEEYYAYQPGKEKAKGVFKWLYSRYI